MLLTHPRRTCWIRHNGGDTAGVTTMEKSVTGRYVADASLMPTVPTSNINIRTIMIGERMGEWLREGD